MTETRARSPRSVDVERFRIFAVPAAVVVGLLLAYAVNTHISGTPNDDAVLNGDFLIAKVVEHLWLSGISFAIAAVLGAGLGLLIAGAGRALRGVVFLVANLGQAVPGIGILFLLYAFLGLGVEPTVVALVAYGTLPVLRNTVVGLQGVDPAAVEAARGMGMTRLQALLRVELPLASPLIFAGLRTSLVLIIGTATLGSFIGGGGLGVVISSGITISNRIIFVGAVLVAALALFADWALSLVERITVPHRVRT